LPESDFKIFEALLPLLLGWALRCWSLDLVRRLALDGRLRALRTKVRHRARSYWPKHRRCQHL